MNSTKQRAGRKAIAFGTALQRNRSTLPKEAQKAYMVSETISTHRLNTEVDNKNSGSQRQKDEQVVETVKDTAKTVRKWLPW